ncbi:MAG TPA: PDZ domain-containing protein [Vicinamibacterales bacterium]
MRVVVRLVGVLAALCLPLAAQTNEPAPIIYRVSFPALEHRFAQVEVTFTQLPPSPLEVRMSRSSPGRYALHEFAKNVYDVHAVDGKGQELEVTRPNPYQWDVRGHDGTVRVAYKVYGDHVDGTYLAIDTTHAHMNLPATLMWARHLEDRPAQVTFVPPAGVDWKPATQLFPGRTPWTFTAPNLQYLFDSPTELSAYALRQFTVHNPDGQAFTIRAAVHSQASAQEVDQYAAGLEKIVSEAMAVYGEFPQYEPGTYTFLADYLPYDSGDGMEHRNSTVVTGRSLVSALNTASHEFFHCWNVERIRPQGLEPFNFEEANMTDSLWLAEGFTQYYGPLIMARAGLLDAAQAVGQEGRLANAVVNGSGRQFRSAVDMSRMAPFVDAARAVDRTNFSTTFISYYTYGGAIALGLDLTLRDRTNGKVSLDDFMRAMWRTYGRPGGPQPGLVAHPYSLTDIRDRLAEVSGDRAFATDFFNRYIVGREVVDYARLLARAGFVWRTSAPPRAWLGDLRVDPQMKIADLVAPGTPAYDAGLEQDDVLTGIDGKDISTPPQLQEILRTKHPGDRVTIAFTRRDGPRTASVTLKDDPSVDAVPLEATGGTPTPEQKAFRDQWLGSRQR